MSAPIDIVKATGQMAFHQEVMEELDRRVGYSYPDRKRELTADEMWDRQMLYDSICEELGRPNGVGGA